MNAADGTWTLAVKIGLPVAALATLILIALMVLAIRWAIQERYKSYGDPALAWAGAGACALGVLALVITCAVGYWPYKAEYHQYRTVSGTVATIANRLVSAGDQGGSNQKFVVVLTSGPQQYGIEDTRAALLHPGDHVSLQCIRVYDYGSTDAGYDCKWGQS